MKYVILDSIKVGKQLSISSFVQSNSIYWWIQKAQSFATFMIQAMYPF